MNVTIDKAVSILRDVEAVAPGVNTEYARGASEAIALVMGFRNFGDAAEALLTLATLKQPDMA